MCKFCERNDLDDLIPLKSEKVDVTAGKYIKLQHSLDMWIDPQADKGWTIGATYWTSESPVVDCEMVIKYCPFCGRELKRNDK